MKQVLRDALDDRGYSTLTPVQEAVLAPELQGRDLLVSAQTGSGKTVGFGLAVAPVLLDDADRFDAAAAPLGLVIAPTRELALQVKRELGWLFAKAGAVIASCVGGMDMRDERRALARGAHIVAATPGRLRDHIMRGSIDMSALRAVVLDEADEMLDLGFREDLEFILGEAPAQRQTLMFSATVPKSIAQLAQSYQQDAERIVVKSGSAQHADISYNAMVVAPHDTENAVINTLLFHHAPNAIVFANTRAMVNRLTTRLSNRGFQVVALSGELSQTERTHALQAMRDGRAQVCVATDVAARGIDLPNLDLVVHAELPSNHETLLHRSGRTGRAGRKGVSALVVSHKTRRKAERILQMAKVRAEWTDAPSAEAVQTREEARMYAHDTWEQPVEAGEQEVVAQLAQRFSPAQLAAAYLRLYRSVRSAPEELSDVNAKPAPREAFGASVWFSVTGGRDAGAEPRRLLPMLLKAPGLRKEDIGAIRIQQSQSFVQVKETAAPTLLASVGEDMQIEPGATVAQLAEPPVLDQGRPGQGAKPPRRPSKPLAKGAAARSRAAVDDGPAARPRAERPARDTVQADKSARTPAGPATNKARKPVERAAASVPDATAGDAPLKRRKPETGKASEGKAKGKPTGKPKGPPPPVGKASSKKNRARALAARAKGVGARGGTGKPHRKGAGKPGKPPRG